MYLSGDRRLKMIASRAKKRDFRAAHRSIVVTAKRREEAEANFGTKVKPV
jgi:hypothetical protein